MGLEKKVNVLVEGLKYACPIYGDIYCYKKMGSKTPFHDKIASMALFIVLKYWAFAAIGRGVYWLVYHH